MKTKLSEYVKNRILELGLNTINALGQLIGMKPVTLRTMLDRNVFSQDAIQLLIDNEVLTGSLNDLISTYEFRIAQPHRRSAKFNEEGEMVQKLSELIKQSLEDRHLSQQQLADQLQVPGGSIKGWLSQNRFPGGVLQQMINRGVLPNLPISELELRYDFQVTRPCDRNPRFEATDVHGIILRAEDQAVKPADEETFGKMVRTLFYELKQNDICWLMTNTEVPIEWNLAGWQSVGDELCVSLKKGAKLFYLSPDVSGLHKELFRGFADRIVARGFDAELVRRQVHLKQIGLDQAPPIGSKVAIFREAALRRVTTLVNTRVPGERWINYRPSAEFANQMLGTAFKAANLH